LEWGVVSADMGRTCLAVSKKQQLLAE
jgi:hypothetical protein